MQKLVDVIHVRESRHQELSKVMNEVFKEVKTIEASPDAYVLTFTVEYDGDYDLWRGFLYVGDTNTDL